MDANHSIKKGQHCLFADNENSIVHTILFSIVDIIFISY